MGTGNANVGKETSGQRPNQQVWKSAAGLLALLLLILNVLVLALAYAVIPDKSGVDSGLGFGFLIIFFSFPLALFTIFLGILSLIWKQGRIPGTIALVVAGGAVLFFVYGFFETQVF